MKKTLSFILLLLTGFIVEAQKNDSLYINNQPYIIASNMGAITTDSTAISCIETQLVEVNSKLESLIEYKNNDQLSRYKLFPTHNTWTFIRLDTRTGKMWQVQYSVEDNQGIWIMNSSNLISYYDEPINGRFTLYQTQNIYNFVLLDQINGNMWQVQWSTKDANRGIIYTY
ncbi:MAG: hypothetical protein SNH64_05325 [Rikenellaceae bacterium]